MPDENVIEGPPDSPSSLSGYGPRYQRKFTVIASSEDDAREVLKANKGVTEGVEYTNHQGKTPDPWCVCIEVLASPRTQVPIDGTGLFDVSAQYGYEDTQNYRRSIPANGQTRRYLRRSITSVAVDRDKRGYPITNAADEPIDPPLQKLVVDKILVIEWWKLFPTWAHAEAYCSTYDGKVNDEAYYSAPPWCLFCLGIDPEESPIQRSIAGMKPYKLTAQFQFQPTKNLLGPNGSVNTYGGWKSNPLNWGRRVRGASDYKHILMKPDNTGLTLTAPGTRISDPVLLSRTGFNFESIPGNANYMEYELYDAIDFNSLGV